MRLCRVPIRGTTPALALAVSLALWLGACSGDEEPNSMSGDGSGDVQTMDCGGTPTVIGGNHAEYTLEGDCPEVSVEGTEIDVNLGGVTLGSLTIVGDRNEIDDAETPTEVTVRGHDNEVDVTDIGTLVVVGDGNDVDARSEIDLVRIDGNSNRVETDYLGVSSEDGSGNEIESNG